MLTQSSLVRLTSLVALLIGCSSESADPGGNGGSNNGTGGANTTGTGGTTTTGNGGTTSTGNGGATTTVNGGNTSTGNGGATNTGNGGSTTSSNGGSTTASNGGSTTSSNGGSTTSSNGGATTTANGGGIATAGSASTPCPTGCAQVSVPFTAWSAAQQFEIYFSAPLDLSTATITVKLRRIAGKAGGVQIIAKNGSPDYAWAQSKWNGLSDISATDFTAATLVLATPDSSDTKHTFDATKVAMITVQLNAGGAWYSDEAKTMEDLTALINPSIVQIDDIAITGAAGTVPGPYAFDTAANTELLKANLDASGMSATPPWAIAGSTVQWVGP